MKFFENGAKVSWTSTAGGFDKTKEGQVIAFIPAGSVPVQVYPALKKIPTGRIRLGNGIDGVSTNDRYLIEVRRQGRYGARLHSHYYAPLMSTINKQN